MVISGRQRMKYLENCWAWNTLNFMTGMDMYSYKPHFPSGVELTYIYLDGE
jgi:hypothetical protein